EADGELDELCPDRESLPCSFFWEPPLEESCWPFWPCWPFWSWPSFLEPASPSLPFSPWLPALSPWSDRCCPELLGSPFCWREAEYGLLPLRAPSLPAADPPLPRPCSPPFSSLLPGALPDLALGSPALPLLPSPLPGLSPLKANFEAERFSEPMGT